MKAYNGEKAIISLTSWKSRINTVSKTLFSLLRACPGFHIVLVLSEEEFPDKEKELPSSVIAFANMGLIEILWVYKNCKSFKKVLFTMDKYRGIPVISADDDCFYTCNFAEELYQKWSRNSASIISQSILLPYKDLGIFGGGWGVIFPPCFLQCFQIPINEIPFEQLHGSNDDLFYVITAKLKNIPIISLGKKQLSELVIYSGDGPESLTNSKQHETELQYNEYYSFIRRVIS